MQIDNTRSFSTDIFVQSCMFNCLQFIVATETRFKTLYNKSSLKAFQNKKFQVRESLSTFHWTQLRDEKSTSRIPAFKFESKCPTEEKRGKKGIKKLWYGFNRNNNKWFTTKLYCKTLVFIPLINIGTFYPRSLSFRNR